MIKTLLSIKNYLNPIEINKRLTTCPVGFIDSGVKGVNLEAMLCSLFGEEIKRNMADKINALDYEAGPPLSERPKLLEQNADQLLQLETVEEELICEAEKQGWSIDRRLDVRPEIFLEWEANPDV